jgi:type II secretory pathway pseudopilin PulG
LNEFPFPARVFVMYPAQTKVESKPDSAFSRMELIVVMAMVAVLLVIALSAQAKPRNRVYQMMDVSNHRRIMQAMISFAGDHSDILPNPCWGTVQKGWAYGASFPVGGGGSLAAYEAVYPQQLASVTNGQLFSYLQDPRVFMCPADRPSNPLFWQRNVYITSYTWNAAVDGYGSLSGSTPSAYKLSQFRPDAILEWEEDDRMSFFWNDASSYPDESISVRHGTNNISFGMFGGGVVTLSYAAWYGNSLAGAAGSRGSGILGSLLPNRLWCNPGQANGL